MAQSKESMTLISRHFLGWTIIIASVACADTGTLADVSPGHSSVSRVVPKGEIDTLRLSPTIAAEVDNRIGVGDLEVGLSPVGDSGALSSKLALGSVVLRMTREGSGAGIRDVRRSEPGAVVTLLVNTVQRTAASIRQFLLVDSNDPLAIPLWTTSNATQYVDPGDGSVKTVEMVSLAPPAGQSSNYLLQLADLGMDCDLGPRLVDLDRDAGSGSRIPLILIHGWQPTLVACHRDDLSRQGRRVLTSFQEWDTDDNMAPFDSLLADLREPANAALRARYHLYVLHYPTFRGVIAASAYLRDQLARLPGGAPVIVAHSMGGLVARGMLGLMGAPTIRGLITLGTPHEGTPLASIVARTSPSSALDVLGAFYACGGFLGLAAGAIGFTVPSTAGIRDLAPESDFIGQLKAFRPQADRVSTIAGSNNAIVDPDLGVLEVPACVLGALSGGQLSDGVVPVSSARPAWSAGEHLLVNANHLALTSDLRARGIVRDLLTRLATCDAITPPLPASRPFALSGSIVRRDKEHIDITINGILINGIPQTGLSKANFAIVENGCAVPQADFELTTAEGRVPVDIVFVQDLSGSMNNAISSVRNSVNSFATALVAQGLDVRFGSVGYSGDVGTIPPTPASSPFEMLGPVQDITDVNTFREHVANLWSSGGGGDAPENGLEAIEYAMDNLSWRDGAARILVDITNSGHHTTATTCKGYSGFPVYGRCTDETLASVIALLSGRAVLHAVAPASLLERTEDGGLDPWLVASASGGKSLVLGTGAFDLGTIGVTEVIAATSRLTFRSASSSRAPENFRILVTINGQTSELSPGLIPYTRMRPSLMR